MDDLVQRLRGDWPEILVEKHWMMDSDAIDKQRAEAADRIEALEAENSRLKAIVHGWHWLAVGPDEMGDYYTQKQLIEASKPYASPALKEIGDDIVAYREPEEKK